LPSFNLQLSQHGIAAMLIPCIDLQSGQAVQLVHGRHRELAISDVFAQLEKFRRYKWLHIIDLDAAMNKTHNNTLVASLCRRAQRKYKMNVRVGGGIRTVVRAKKVAKLGATQIIIGSAVFARGKINQQFLSSLARAIPREKIVLALDVYRGTITTHGWRKSLAMRPEDVMPALEPYCAAFLCTDVDREGTLAGADLAYFASLRAATDHPIIAAGGITTAAEVTELSKLKMDAAVGMALYKNLLR
jgi:phosphoribosylformimino-5-aminoimidazole carboxamide ribotide isomerase